MVGLQPAARHTLNVEGGVVLRANFIEVKRLLVDAIDRIFEVNPQEPMAQTPETDQIQPHCLKPILETLARDLDARIGLS